MLGAVAALILAAPLFGEVRDRRHWQRLIRFSRRAQPDGVPAGQKTKEEIAVERRLRDQMNDARLGDVERYRFTAFLGFSLLLASFVFLAIAAIDRAAAP